VLPAVAASYLREESRETVKVTRTLSQDEIPTDPALSVVALGRARRREKILFGAVVGGVIGVVGALLVQ